MCVCVCVCVCVRMYMYSSMCVYACLYVCIHAWVPVLTICYVYIMCVGTQHVSVYISMFDHFCICAVL